MREPASEMIRIRQAEPMKQIHRARLSLPGAGDTVLQRGLDDLFHQPLGRIEGRRRRLGDISDLLAAQFSKTALAALQDVATVQPDLAARDPHATPAIAHCRQPDGGLAGARLADQAQNLALFQGQRDVLDDHDVLGLLAVGVDRRLDPEVPDVEEGIRHRGLLSDRRSG